MRHPLLCARPAATSWVKHENHNPTGAFKVRGGLNLVGSRCRAQRRGVITASTGNHGQSIAFACQRDGVPCTDRRARAATTPRRTRRCARWAPSVDRVRPRLRRGARGSRAAAPRAAACATSTRPTSRCSSPASATYALEIFEELPDADVVLVPIGGGSGACGLRHRADGARQPRRGHRRPGRARRRVRAIVAKGDARRRRKGATPLPKAWRRA